METRNSLIFVVSFQDSSTHTLTLNSASEKLRFSGVQERFSFFAGMYWKIVLINLPEIRGCNRQRDSLDKFRNPPLGR